MWSTASRAGRTAATSPWRAANARAWPITPAKCCKDDVADGLQRPSRRKPRPQQCRRGFLRIKCDHQHFILGPVDIYCNQSNEAVNATKEAEREASLS